MSNHKQSFAPPSTYSQRYLLFTSDNAQQLSKDRSILAAIIQTEEFKDKKAMHTPHEPGQGQIDSELFTIDDSICAAALLASQSHQYKTRPPSSAVLEALLQQWQAVYRILEEHQRNLNKVDSWSLKDKTSRHFGITKANLDAHILTHRHVESHLNHMLETIKKEPKITPHTINESLSPLQTFLRLTTYDTNTSQYNEWQPFNQHHLSLTIPNQSAPINLLLKKDHTENNASIALFSEAIKNNQKSSEIPSQATQNQIKEEFEKAFSRLLWSTYHVLNDHLDETQKPESIATLSIATDQTEPEWLINLKKITFLEQYQAMISTLANTHEKGNFNENDYFELDDPLKKLMHDENIKKQSLIKGNQVKNQIADWESRLNENKEILNEKNHDKNSL